MELLEFYPTPKSLLDKILAGIDWFKVSTVLEPSAGVGNIVEYIKENSKVYKGWSSHEVNDIDCIELNPDLSSTLKGKGFRVVHDDFLTFNTFKHYDLIVMNPPFSNGDKHLLRALDLQKRNGGDIICILNAETVKNPYSAVRKDLVKRLEDINADIEFMENEFTSAERTTNVEIAVIKAHYDVPQLKASIFDKLKAKRYADDKVDMDVTDLAPNDFVEAIVKAYQLEIEAGILLIKHYRAMLPHLQNTLDKENNYSKPILKMSVGDHGSLSINDYIKRVRMKYWTQLFQDKRITGKMTSNLRNQFANKVSELKDYDFSTYNIRTLQIEMSKHLVSGIEECIVKTFDELSYQYSYHGGEYEKNVHYYNGWKTNKSWIINKKVIIPMYGLTDWHGDLRVDYYDVVSRLRDIEKSLDYLDNGATLYNTDLENTLSAAQNRGESKNIRLKYFNVTFYKKGTCHITFTNEKLLKKLNIFGSQQKGWLPQTYGKKEYNDMSVEEQSVIKEFEGVDGYRDTMKNKDFYLVDTNSYLQLEEKGA